MPYVMETCIAGKTIEVDKHYSSRVGRKGIRRGKNINPTPEDVHRVNEREAAKKLRRTLNENCGVGDAHTVLTYRRDERPTPQEARKDLEKFLRLARQYFREQGKELRYITVTEYKRARIHHHLVIPEIPAKVLYALWGHGRPHVTPLDDSGNYAQLADYLIKETAATFRDDSAPYHKRWNQSRNMRQPKVTRRVVQASQWRKEPKPRAGYYIDKDSVRAGTHETNGYEYQFYRMVEIPKRRKNHGAETHVGIGGTTGPVPLGAVCGGALS